MPVKKKKGNREWLVVYNVKYCEEWCADECTWLEESCVVEAPTKRTAQLMFRKKNAHRQRFMIGTHVSTRRAFR